MIVEKAAAAVYSQVALQGLFVRFGQVDDDQAVEDVAELGVDVESQHPAAQVQVLPEQNRHPLLLDFDVGDDGRDLLETTRRDGVADLDLEGRVAPGSFQRPLPNPHRGELKPGKKNS